MSSAFDGLVDLLADAVARRVIELQKAEAAQQRVSYLTPQLMAERMGVSVKTLANLRSAKRGPKFVKVGGAVRYPVNDNFESTAHAAAIPMPLRIENAR